MQDSSRNFFELYRRIHRFRKSRENYQEYKPSPHLGTGQFNLLAILLAINSESRLTPAFPAPRIFKTYLLPLSVSINVGNGATTDCFMKVLEDHRFLHLTKKYLRWQDIH